MKLILIIILMVALLAPCAHAQNSDSQKLLSALSGLVHRNYSPGQELARRNNQYLIDNLGENLKLFTTIRIYQNGEMEDVLTGEEALKEELVSRLKAIPHTFGNREGKYSKFLDEGPESARKLTIRQLLRVRLLLNDLEHKEFVKMAGSLMESQPIGAYDEAGGIGTISQGRTAIAEKLNAAKGGVQDPLYNGSYTLPEEAKRSPQLFFVHTHGHHGDYSDIGSGPSLIESLIENCDSEPPKVSCIKGDIGYALREAFEHGEFHGVVTSRLKGKGFNLDYFGVEIGNIDRNNFRDVLGRVVILDLGNYIIEGSEKINPN